MVVVTLKCSFLHNWPDWSVLSEPNDKLWIMIITNLVPFLGHEFLNADTDFQIMCLFGPSPQLISVNRAP